MGGGGLRTGPVVRELGGGWGCSRLRGPPPLPGGCGELGPGSARSRGNGLEGGPAGSGETSTEPGELLGSPALGVLEEVLGLVLGDTARGLEQVRLGTFSNRNDPVILGEGEPRASISSVCMGGCKRMEPGSAGCAR